ncbi:hypothetical protein Tsubulata_011896 [Turnera subulata]|uniref:WRKY domain-containing protein n=1 Tax=Turnera subulata TaxID=218843 RepID=A0A9Q0F5R2_9ROSI|nr:hypothetical protein Tsubulata_011896 [Turnera subulata]
MHVAVAINKDRSTMELDSKGSSSSLKDQARFVSKTHQSSYMDDQLESARSEMGEVREENQRLRSNLERIMKDYRNLQKQFHDFVHQEETKKSTITVDDNQTNEEPELVSLSLGRTFSSEFKRDNEKNKSSSEGKDHEQAKEGLSLGLDCNFEVSNKSEANTTSNPSPANSFEEPKEEAAGETWPPSKALKTMRSGDEEVLQQNPAKKARVSVRARCDTPTMNDGCQWRKYGQKIAKGNPCPRAYYRCTVAPSCPVRKQVQRCADDMSILITTYEGTHNHPLPIAATAMASTTSAAASMLLSGSSSSRPGSTQSASSTTINATDLHGLNFYLSDNSKPKQFYVHNSSLSSAPSCPTITLDLTSYPSAAAASSSHSNRFSTIPKYSSTSLSFGSSESNHTTTPWINASSILSYGSTSQPSYNNRSPFGNLNLGRSSPFDGSNIYQPYMTKNAPVAPPHQAPPDTIAAATRAITADPSFQSALVAALSSIIGSGNASASGGGGANLGGGVNSNDNIAQKLKWGEHFPLAASYLNKTTSTSSQSGNVMFLPPSLPFASPRNSSASPSDQKTTAIKDLEMRL